MMAVAVHHRIIQCFDHPYVPNLVCKNIVKAALIANKTAREWFWRSSINSLPLCINSVVPICTSLLGPHRRFGCMEP